MRSAKCGGKHAYHTAWGDLQKANAKQPSKQRKGEGYSLSLSLVSGCFLKAFLKFFFKILSKFSNFFKFFKNPQFFRKFLSKNLGKIHKFRQNFIQKFTQIFIYFLSANPYFTLVSTLTPRALIEINFLSKESL